MNQRVGSAPYIKNVRRYLVPVAQSVAAVRVMSRLMRSANGQPIPENRTPGTAGEIAILIPVLDEAMRLPGCLTRVCAQGPEVGEILVIDGGSTDETVTIIKHFAEMDERVRLIVASPPPIGANGKAWQLEAGRRAIRSAAQWIVTIDADVHISQFCCQSLMRFARQTGLPLASVATTQRLSGPMDALIHPAMLTTLVYRFGIPGRWTTRPADVQASGQCMVLDRQILMRNEGFTKVYDSVCEDVSLARQFAHSGMRVGFYESEGLAETAMYSSGKQTLVGWSRSLPMRDRYANMSSLVRIGEVLVVQALPLWRLVLPSQPSRTAVGLDRALFAMRCGILVGTARAYPNRPWTYWLSPLTDLPVAMLLIARSMQRTFRWRGRVLTSRIGDPS